MWPSSCTLHNTGRGCDWLRTFFSWLPMRSSSCCQKLMCPAGAFLRGAIAVDSLVTSAPSTSSASKGCASCAYGRVSGLRQRSQLITMPGRLARRQPCLEHCRRLLAPHALQQDLAAVLALRRVVLGLPHPLLLLVLALVALHLLAVVLVVHCSARDAPSAGLVPDTTARALVEGLPRTMPRLLRKDVQTAVPTHGTRPCSGQAVDALTLAMQAWLCLSKPKPQQMYKRAIHKYRVL